jgi:hypothetical protein
MKGEENRITRGSVESAYFDYYGPLFSFPSSLFPLPSSSSPFPLFFRLHFSELDVAAARPDGKIGFGTAYDAPQFFLGADLAG